MIFSTIIPISLTVNLDMGKSASAWFIGHDKGIKDTVLLLGLAIQLDVATARTGREIGPRVRDVVLSLCHNTTLITNTSEGALEATVTYQASSMGEIAVSRRTESVGLSPRDRKRMKLQNVDTGKVAVRA